LFSNQQENEISIKIGDFGFAKEGKQYLRSIVGTSFFLSPEMMMGIPYSAKTDVW